MSATLARLEVGVAADDTNRRVRSIDEHMAEMKDLLVEALRRR